jgi:hypothetical protein
VVPEGLGLIVTAREGRFLLWSGQGKGPLLLHLDGYERRFADLADVCRGQQIGLFLGGLLPLGEEVGTRLRECAGEGLHLSADREFRGQLRRLLPGLELPLTPAERPPVNALPVTLFSLVRDPVWRLLADLAIPLPRRLALVVEEPWLALRADRESLGEAFGHFLDIGGRLSDRIYGRIPPPHPSLAWGMSRIFPRAPILEPPLAAALGLRERWRRAGQPLPERWLLVYAGWGMTTVWALRGDRIAAGVAHATAALTAAKLNDLLAQLAAGWRLDEEVRLDGGLYAATRLLPEEPGPWRPVIVTGPAAADFAVLGDPPPPLAGSSTGGSFYRVESRPTAGSSAAPSAAAGGPQAELPADADRPLALVAEGLAALLTSPKPAAS